MSAVSSSRAKPCVTSPARTAAIETGERSPLRSVHVNRERNESEPGHHGELVEVFGRIFRTHRDAVDLPTTHECAAGCDRGAGRESGVRARPPRNHSRSTLRRTARARPRTRVVPPATNRASASPSDAMSNARPGSRNTGIGAHGAADVKASATRSNWAVPSPSSSTTHATRGRLPAESRNGP